MEGSNENENFHLWEVPSWDVNNFDQFLTNWNPINFGAPFSGNWASLEPELTADFEPDVQFDVSGEGSLLTTTHYNQVLSPLASGPTFMTGAVFPATQCDSLWGSSLGGSSTCTSPSDSWTWNVPPLSPDPLALHSPFACAPPTTSPGASTSLLVDYASSMAGYTGDGLGEPETCIPTAGAEAPRPSQATTTPRDLTMADCPPGVSSRKWRYLIRPEHCPGCPMGFPFKTDLGKHMAARHPDLALAYGVPLKMFVCRWCGRAFKRKDHHDRHLKKKHGG